MRIIKTIKELRQVVGRRDGRVGFVPTMGALHAGHVSLMERSRRECDVVVASIFVNPLQFSAGEDLARYPRTFDADGALAAAAGVDVLFAPTNDEMYPQPMQVRVLAGPLGEWFEGASRPGHFDGVATVVTKLLSIVGPCRAYFGEKDFQQLAVIRQLVVDLNLPIDVVSCPTLRERDGLAMSSRNAYLSPPERDAAAVLFRALELARSLGTGVTVAESQHQMADVVKSEPLVQLDYAVIVNSRSLTLASGGSWPASPRALIAAHVGSTRLIDNAAIS